MTESHHICLVAAFEIRPPSPDASWMIERERIERLGGAIAEDLAALTSGVTRGHLVVGPALLEPAQLLNPEFAPWRALQRLAGIDDGFEPGVTSIGAHRGRAPAEALAPLRAAPEGLLVCLPLLLAADPSVREPLRAELERVLFERGGLRPPAMGELASATGLEPVHGQLMTRADLFALFKVQLAGAGLDPFWPPVEHAMLEPERALRLDLPGGVDAAWQPDPGCWELAFRAYDEAEDADGWTLWLRALRQAGALMDSCLVRWRPVAGSPGTTLDSAGGWAERTLGSSTAGEPGYRIEHPEVGLVAYRADVDGRRRAYYPLEADAISDLERHLHALGVERFEPADDLDLLRLER